MESVATAVGAETDWGDETESDRADDKLTATVVDMVNFIVTPRLRERKRRGVETEKMLYVGRVLGMTKWKTPRGK